MNAEGDGRGAQRTLSSPNVRRRLALAWPAILGICVGGLVLVAIAAAVFARRRTRRAFQVHPAEDVGLCHKAGTPNPAHLCQNGQIGPRVTQHLAGGPEARVCRTRGDKKDCLIPLVAPRLPGTSPAQPVPGA